MTTKPTANLKAKSSDDNLSFDLRRLGKRKRSFCLSRLLWERKEKVFSQFVFRR